MPRSIRKRFKVSVFNLLIDFQFNKNHKARRETKQEKEEKNLESVNSQNDELDFEKQRNSSSRL